MYDLTENQFRQVYLHLTHRRSLAEDQNQASLFNRILRNFVEGRDPKPALMLLDHDFEKKRIQKDDSEYPILRDATIVLRRYLMGS